MSYCRFGNPESDAYIYPSIQGGIVCCACRLLPKIKYPSGYVWYQDFVVDTADEMLTHAIEHNLKDSPVPAYAIERLTKEAIDV